MTKNLTDNKDTSSYLHEQKWGDEKNSSTLILAVHGYNDHSKSFEIPANFFKNLIFFTVAFDLRGFGKNSNAGSWYSLKNHIFDLKEKLLEIKKKTSKKKNIFIGREYGRSDSY